MLTVHFLNSILGYHDSAPYSVMRHIGATAISRCYTSAKIMGRIEAIARSIVRVIVGGAKKRSRSPIAFILAFFSTIFSFYELPLHKHRADVFGHLREKWEVLEDEYVASFRAEEGDKPEDVLFTMANMGFSGSVSTRAAMTSWCVMEY